MLADLVSHDQYVAVNLDRLHTSPYDLPTVCPVWENISMQRLELTLPTPAENLALDEALLDWAEGRKPRLGILAAVGIAAADGRGWPIDACAPGSFRGTMPRERSIPILPLSQRRCGYRRAGPGCLMYAVVLSYALRPELQRYWPRTRVCAATVGREPAITRCGNWVLSRLKERATSCSINAGRHRNRESFPERAPQASERTCCTTARCSTAPI